MGTLKSKNRFLVSTERPFCRDMPVAGRFKAYFLRGLAALLPTVLTIWIFVWGYSFIQQYLGEYIKTGIRQIIVMAGGAEAELDKFWINHALSVASFLIALIAVCVVGVLLASVVGKTFWKIIENFIMNTPLLRRIYPYIKQVTDFLITGEDQKKLFKRVVAVEYPRKGIWSLGFVTGSGIEKVQDGVQKELLTILIPTSPAPFTGFVIMVPAENTIELDITIEEALRFTVSGGVITPLGEKGAAVTKKNLHDKNIGKIEVTNS